MSTKIKSFFSVFIRSFYFLLSFYFDKFCEQKINLLVIEFIVADAAAVHQGIKGSKSHFEVVEALIKLTNTFVFLQFREFSEHDELHLLLFNLGWHQLSANFLKLLRKFRLKSVRFFFLRLRRAANENLIV